MGTKSKVIRLNSKKTLSMLTERINKKVEKTGGNDRDTMLLLSIIHRHMHFRLSTAK